jgi:hypothetical protein
MRSFPNHFKKIFSTQNTENYLLILHKKKAKYDAPRRLVKKNFINQLNFQRNDQVKRVSNFFRTSQTIVFKEINIGLTIIHIEKSL